VKNLEFVEFQALAARGNVIPVYRAIMGDLLTPVSAFMHLKTLSNRTFLFESVEGGEKTARYSFMGCNPFQTLRATDRFVEIEQDGNKTRLEGDIFQILKEQFSRYRVVHPEALPRFTGGAVGFFGYETIGLIERIPKHPNKDVEVPEAIVMLFETILAFDHLSHQIFICSNVILDDKSDLKQVYDHAMAKIANLQQTLAGNISQSPNGAAPGSSVTSNISKAAFCRCIETAKAYIQAGDIFQVVLSQRFQKEINIAPFDIYRALRVINPSPYLYFLQIDGFYIIGSSPELLVRVEDDVCEVRPIAGTRPRGASEAEDRSLAADLLADKKEIAEHVMLVDLGRNDVGRVCRYGSVEVSEFMVIERYSHVMHIVSNVRGRLKAGCHALDALRAGFPAGTVSGAPKIRAMEIITELEKCQRGVYAGALGYLDFSGNLDTCIAIRTIFVTGKQAYFQAGAGIVSDSVPEREYEETVSKASALQAAIEFAERGLQ
jgi:anthranilate synthase component 1